MKLHFTETQDKILVGKTLVTIPPSEAIVPALMTIDSDIMEGSQDTRKYYGAGIKR